ncbi:hypothetical protein ACLMJK_005915 [Lecanora helva]
MATLSADKLTKVSTEGWSEDAKLLLPWCCEVTISTYVSSIAAANFVESFYAALNNSRETIASYYMPATTMTDGKSLPVILFNSNVIEGPTAMQTLFKEKMPESQYEVQDYDCHVLNSHYVPQDAEGPSQETAKNMIILITINGQVRYGDVKSTLNSQKGFSESIVLAPNPAAVGNERGKPVKEWLIQSQNFRLVI